MKLYNKSILLFIISSLFAGCFSDFDDNDNSNVKDFVWKGMNYVYLYKDFVPDLANDRFASDLEYNDYLEDFSSPEELFDELQFSPTDEFSWLEDDYIRLEQLLSGTSVSNGMEFALYLKPQNQNEVYGIVRYVLPNTSAETNGAGYGSYDGHCSRSLFQ